MRQVHHVTHTPAALRIIDEQRISRNLIYDECKLNDSRTTVIWLSPNQWHFGSRYGSVQFTFHFDEIVKGREIYWVEAHTGYSPHACRFLITDQKIDHLPVQNYDVTREDGPLKYVNGLWYWNYKFTGEFILEASLDLSVCRTVDFIRHHANYCAIGGCKDQGKEGDHAAGRVISYILSREINAIDAALTITKPKMTLSTAIERGLSNICAALGALGVSANLKGPLRSDSDVDAVLRAAMLQYAEGERDLAKETASLIASGDILRDRLNSIVESHFGSRSDILTN